VQDVKDDTTREKFRKKLRSGALEEKKVEVKITKNAMPAIEIFSGSNFEEVGMNLGGLAGMFGDKKKKKRVTVRQARNLLNIEEMEKLVDLDSVTDEARDRTENMGIVFIDEIDKIASRENRSGVDVSREGVQRDILPIIEGSKVNTKFGLVDTAHILFIAAGAFHSSKPSDLIPELQGRFPLRVELDPLTRNDLYEVLTKPKNALITQYSELIATEDVRLEFSDDAIMALAKIAEEVNTKTENIGARRLHTMMELLLEDVSFNASDLTGQTIKITQEYVRECLDKVVEDQDLSRYIL
jgi:ATP-dependent HslUV protease ATP-binding subunit HslU